MDEPRQDIDPPRAPRREPATGANVVAESPGWGSKISRFREMVSGRKVLWWKWFLAQPIWFRSALALGLILRLYCVIFTEGTSDVGYWQHHAERVSAIGLVNYYHETPYANHPPLMSEISVLLLRFSGFAGIPFRMVLRLPYL